AGGDDRITLTNFFTAAAGQTDHAIELIEFADGTLWSLADIYAQLGAGSAGDDSIDLGTALDITATLSGGAGDDRLAGGIGDTTYKFGIGSGRDTIVEGTNWSGSDDVLQLGTGIAAADVIVIHDGADLIVRLRGSDDRVTIKGQATATNPPIDRVIFADGQIWTAAALLAQAVTPAAAEAALHPSVPGANPFTDPLFGTSTGGGTGGTGGTGGGSDDGSAVGPGTQVLTGTSGQDTYRLFVPTLDDGSLVTITDFQSGSSGDILDIRLAAGLTGTVVTRQEGADTSVYFVQTGTYRLDEARLVARLRGVTASALTLANFNGAPFANAANLSLSGDNGANTLTGGWGADTLVGNGGNDTLTGGTENDTLQGGEGSDTYKFSRGFGQDIVSDGGWRTANSPDDIVEFDATIAPEDIVVELSADGASLLLKVAGTEDRVTLQSTITSDANRIERVRFVAADGTITYWTHADLVARAVPQVGTGIGVTGTAAGETITGSALSDTLAGGGGDDILIGDSPSVYAATGANLVVNGSFEQSAATYTSASWGRSSTTLPGWTLEGNSFEQVNSGHQGVPATDGSFWLDLDSTGSNGNVTISQQFSGLAAGQQLMLRFDYANRTSAASGPFEVLWNDAVIASYSLTGTGMRPATLFVTAMEGANKLSFRGLGTVDGEGASLDNVRLSEYAVTTAVTEGRDSLSGGAGNDTLHGGGNVDTLSGGADNDTLYGEAGDDSLSGDAGADILVGGRGSDTLAGGDGDDVYRFEVGDGQDSITDAAGVDRIEFGAGIGPADIQVSQQGSTNLVLRRGTSGDRVTIVNALSTAANAIEEVRFADGTVWTHAQLLAMSQAPTEGRDVIYGTSAADTLSGGAGDDSINALGGNDTLNGDSGNDSLTGDVGDDTLTGGLGNDSLTGNGGNDVYRFNAGDGQDTITDTAGIDRIELGADIATADVQVVQQGSANLVLRIGTSDRIVLAGALNTAGNAIEEVRFADGTVWTHAQLLVMSQTPTDGRDVLYGTSAADTISGGAGDDSINALGGNDTLGGDAGNDSLTGDVGDDTLTGGTGDDSLAGNAGNDVYRFNAGDGQDTLTDTAGVDRIELGADIAVADVRVVQQGSANLVLRIGTTDRIVLAGALNTAGNAIEEVRFADGTVWTHAQLLTMSQASTDGRDVIYGSGNADTISGGAGDDSINALGGNDTLNGDSGNDSLTGDVGDDTLTGGTGNDTLAGNAGNDVYRFNAGDGQDTLTDTGGLDRIELGAGIAPADVTIVQQGTTGLILKIGANGDRLTLVNQINGAANAIEELRFADGTVWTAADMAIRATSGTPGADVYNGSSGNDTLSGQAGNDTLTGNAGDDQLSGGADNDALDGGAGADRLAGGTGKDRLVGGAGGDTYVFAAGDGQDEIDDNGDATADTLRIEGYSLGQIRFSRTGVDANDLTIRFANSTDKIVVRQALAGTAADTLESFVIAASGITLTLADVQSRLSEDVATTGESIYGTPDADVLTGGTGDDFLSGGAGADTMTGGDGNDIFGDIVADSSVDTMTGGAGRDTYRFLPTFNIPDNFVADVITDFQAGDSGDVIRLSSANPNPFEEGRLRVSQDGADTVILLRNDAGFDRAVLRLVGVNSTDLTAANFGGIPIAREEIVGTATVTWRQNTYVQSGNEDQARMGIGFVDANGSLIGSITWAAYTAPTTWTERTLSAEAPEGATAIRIYQSHSRLSGTNNDGYIDAIALTLNGVSLPLTNAGAESGIQGWVVESGSLTVRSADPAPYDGGAYFAGGTAALTTAYQQISVNSLSTAGDDSDNILVGGPLDDRIFGNGGNDSLSGLGGNDLLAGGQGEDTLDGGFGNDKLAGEAGNDLLIGGQGSDILSGGSGNDTLYGSDSANQWTGDDVLSGGTGDDLLFGGLGNDIYKFAAGDGYDRIRDAGGADRIDFAAGIGPADVAVVQVGSAIELRILGGRDRIRFEADGGSRIETLAFADGTVWTWGDVLQRSQTGGDGDDTLGFAAGGVPNLIRNGDFSEYDPAQVTGSFDWGVRVGSIPGWTDAGGRGFELWPDGSGSGNWLDLEEYYAHMDVRQTVQGLAAGQQLLLTFDHMRRSAAPTGSFEVWWNGQLVAAITSTSPSFRTDTLTLTAAAGDNVLRFVSTGNTSADGVALDNVGLYDLSVVRSDAERTLDGGAGNDNLLGSAFADILRGGRGDDRLAGGLGDDIYVFVRGDGQDVITDALGANELRFAAGIAAGEVRVVAGLATFALEIVGTGDRIDFGTPAAADMGIQTVRFVDGTVWTAATLLAMAQAASAGDDRIPGTTGADVLTGGSGDDTLDALGGNDILNGGTGFDRLLGGAGDDEYRYALGDGFDVISDGAGADTLVFAAGISVADIRVEQVRDGSAMVLVIGDNQGRVTIDQALGAGRIETVRFADGTVLTHADLLARVATNGDDTLFGDGDANVLAGKLGDDFLSGGGGDDSYRFARGDGRDTIQDNAASTADRVEIAGYAASELRFVRRAGSMNDLIVSFADAGDELILLDSLGGNAGIETIVLTDTGETLSLADIGARLLADASSDGDDVIQGTAGADTITGGKGSDLLVGEGGNDIYVYRRGDGDDRIDAFGSGQDEVRLADYRLADVVSAVRAGPDSDNLVIVFAGAGDRLILRDALGSANGSSTSLVVRFADGTVWDRSAMRARAIGDAQSSGNDNVYGFDGADSFANGAGNDRLIGAAGSDAYNFARGNGNDTIEDLSTAGGNLDTVRFLDFASTEATVERLFRGSDSVVIRFASSPADSLTIVDALALDSRAIESYTFSDGVTWSRDTMRALLDNRAPIATDDGFYTVITGQQLVISATEILRNDFDADGDPLRIVAVDAGDNGIASLDAQGNVLFTATGGYAGPVNIRYTLSDGRNAFGEGGIDVRVRPVATAVADTGFTVAEDQYLTIRVERLLSNDLDGDRMIVGQVYGAKNGTVSLSSDGNIAFTPNADFTGQAEFTYVANTPEGGRAEAKVFITVTPVNDAPVAVNNGGFVTAEGTAFDIDPAALLANDRDVDGDRLTITGLISSASVEASFNPDGTIRVTPRDYYWGNAYFDYVVTDAAGVTATARVSINVTPVNDAPEPGADRFELTEAGGPILEDNPIVIGTDRLLGNDIDRDGDTLRVTAVANSHGGAARLLENGTVLFEPSANFNGDAWFDYQVVDDQGGVAWSRATIAYTPVNDRPEAADDHYGNSSLYFLNGTEDTPIVIPIIELLKNDYDPEGFAVFFEQARDAVHGDIRIEGGNIIFTPDQDFWGEATFAYSVTDPEGLVDGGVVTLWFANVGDAPPVAGADTIYVFEDVPTTINLSSLLGNDTDIDRDPLRIIDWAAERGLNGTLEVDAQGNILFTPFRDASTSSGFTYRVTDDADGIATGHVDIVIIPSNDDPTVVDDEGFVTPLDIPLVIRVADLIGNDYDIEQADTDGDGTLDADLDNPDRPRPRFVGVDAVLDPAELAQGNRVAVGSFEVVEFRGEQFVVVRFPQGFTGNVAIEYRIADAEGLEDTGFATASVDNFYGGLLRGSTRIDYVEGGALADTIRTSNSDDHIVALGGNDLIEAGQGNDLIDAGEGDDVIDGGEGADRILGGAGFDTVVFTGATIGVRADLESRVGQGSVAEGDEYVGIEALRGTEFGDTLGGTTGNETLYGEAGDDLLEGRAGADSLYGGQGADRIKGGAGADLIDGGEGSDTADYFDDTASSGATEGVTISLAAGTASRGDAAGDTLVSIENVIGSDFADVIEGDAGANRLEGHRGDDLLDGGAGDDVLVGGRGADALVGGDGVDTADYTLSLEGVTVDMANGAAGSGDAEGDTFSSIEIVHGSYHDDVLRGDGGDNILRGGLGADVLDGRGGVDTADYSTSETAVTVDLSLGQGLAGDAAGDTLVSIEKVIGSNAIDTLIGGTGDDWFDGGFANDQLRGGFGSDSYVVGFDSSEDVVTEIGAESDVDRVLLRGNVLPKDVSLVRMGDDLLIELENDGGFLTDAATIKDHFLGRQTGIEEIVFGNGTVWDRARMDELVRAGRFNAQNDIYRF
ncbi:MAG TPA: calcium-binding protein, partial [Sphingomonas sp.]|nr:calcium-binding protein [Sphingomonas sp.]